MTTPKENQLSLAQATAVKKLDDYTYSATLSDRYSVGTGKLAYVSYTPGLLLILPQFLMEALSQLAF